MILKYSSYEIERILSANKYGATDEFKQMFLHIKKDMYSYAQMLNEFKEDNRFNLLFLITGSNGSMAREFFKGLLPIVDFDAKNRHGHNLLTLCMNRFGNSEYVDILFDYIKKKDVPFDYWAGQESLSLGNKIDVTTEEIKETSIKINIEEVMRLNNRSIIKCMMMVKEIIPSDVKFYLKNYVYIRGSGDVLWGLSKDLKAKHKNISDLPNDFLKLAFICNEATVKKLGDTIMHSGLGDKECDLLYNELNVILEKEILSNDVGSKVLIKKNNFKV